MKKLFFSITIIFSCIYFPKLNSNYKGRILCADKKFHEFCFEGKIGGVPPYVEAKKVCEKYGGTYQLPF